jgi:hypothetical protein
LSTKSNQSFRHIIPEKKKRRLHIVDYSDEDNTSDVEPAGTDIAFDTDTDNDIDSEMELFSEHESDNDIIDDEPVTVDKGVYTTVALNDIRDENDIVNDIIAHVGNSEDVELIMIRKAVAQLDIPERFFSIYLIALSIDQLKNRIDLNEAIDDVMADLHKMYLPSQSGGLLFVIQTAFESFSTWSVTHGDFLKVLDFLSLTSSKLRLTHRDVLLKIGRDCFDYFCSLCDTTTDLRRALKDMLRELCVTCDTVMQCIVSRALVRSDSVEVSIRPQVSLKEPELEKQDVVTTLDDLLRYSESIDLDSISSQLPQKNQKKPPQKRENAVADISSSDIVVWRGTNCEQVAIDSFVSEKIDKNRFRDITQKLYKTEISTFEEAADILNNSMPSFFAMTMTLAKSCKVTVDSARKWANDIVQINNRSALLFLKNNHMCQPTSSQVSNDMQNSQSQSQQIKESVELETKKATFYPSADNLKTVLRKKMNDERFLALPPDWKCKDVSLPAGIFREHCSLNDKTKNVFLCILGEDNVAKFTDSISAFNAFNAEFSMIPKNGIWASETCNKVIRGVPCHSILYVVLSMGRKSQMNDILCQIVWFLNQQRINLDDCLIENFNTDKDFHQCYIAVNDMRIEYEGGYIGSIDVELRKKLKINDNEIAQAQGFRIISQYFQDNGIISTHAAIRCIQECNTCTTYDEESKLFQEAVKSVMGSANIAVNTVKNTMWWNNELKKYRSPFLSNNLGFLMFKTADKLFKKINKLYGGFLLNSNVDILNWDEQEMGDVKYKGTFLQPAILNLVQQLRTAPTDLLYVLKVNRINPVSFFNKICNHLVRAGRRDRTLLLSGPKKSGKSIVAGALLSAFEGVRLSLDMSGGREFNVAESASDNIGLALLEDVSYITMKNYVDKSLRSLMDGDSCLINQKMKATTKGTWRACVITTNVDVNSDSEDEGTKSKVTLQKSDVLDKRYQAIKFRQDLSKSDIKHYVETISEDDVIALFWKYGLYPHCNTMVNGPRCTMSPCESADSFGDHHFNCTLVREVLSNLEMGVEMKVQSNTQINSAYEDFDMVEQCNISLLFDLSKVDELTDCFQCFYQCSDKERLACRSESTREQKSILASKIKHFIDYVWIPLCFSSRYMCGHYGGIEKSPWLKNVVSHFLFTPFVDDSQSLTMNKMLTGFIGNISREDLFHLLKLEWCNSEHPRVKSWTEFVEHTTYTDDDLREIWSALCKKDEKRLTSHVAAYIARSEKKKRFTRTKMTRNLKRVLDSRSSEVLWKTLIGKFFIVEKYTEPRVHLEDIDLRFFD